MESERAKFIIEEAQNIAQGYPWVEAVRKIVTPEEDQEIRVLWKTLPGNYSYIDTILYIKNGMIKK